MTAPPAAGMWEAADVIDLRSVRDLTAELWRAARRPGRIHDAHSRPPEAPTSPEHPAAGTSVTPQRQPLTSQRNPRPAA